MPLTKANSIDYWREPNPKCPHCDHVCEISKNEWYDLYDTQEGEHEQECPSCGKDFKIQVICEFAFSTDHQPEPTPSSEVEQHGT